MAQGRPIYQKKRFCQTKVSAGLLKTGKNKRQKWPDMILLESLHHISLGSSNLDRTAEFYENVLDMEIVERSETHLLVYLEPIAIRFNLVKDYEARATQPSEGSLSYILDVDDFTNAITGLEEKEIEILEGPIAIEGGESLLIQDPDGHFIELFYRD